jgi:CheY-like chemotaxis protein
MVSYNEKNPGEQPKPGNVSKENVKPAGSAKQAKPLAEGAAQTIKQKRVLIVDDEPDVRRFLEKALTNGKFIPGVTFVPTAVENGIQAFEEWDKNQNLNQIFDLIITDRDMGGISGIALAEHVRKTNRQVPIILFSGRSKEDDMELQNAIVSYNINLIQKPVELSIIRSKVREVLNIA